jgi:hypothetical protein
LAKLCILFAVSVAEPDPHQFGGTKAFPRSGSGSNSSKRDVQKGKFSKNGTNRIILLIFLLVFTCTTIFLPCTESEEKRMSGHMLNFTP